MAITLSYKGSRRIFIEACEQANAIMASPEFIKMIASRTTPYKECKPKDLAPLKIAEAFENTHLKFTMEEYERDASIGGAFDPDYPDKILVNVNTWRTGCTYAAVLVHECVHALSFHSPDFKFSHDSDKPKHNQGTAPYAIQKATRKLFCGEELVEDADLIEVELIVNETPIEKSNLPTWNLVGTKTYKNLTNDDVSFVNFGGEKDFISELYSVVAAHHDENRVNVAFNENSTVLSLNKSHPSFNQYSALLNGAKQNGLKIEVIYDAERDEIIEVNPAPLHLITRPYNKENRFLPYFEVELTPAIESHAKLLEIFDFIVKQSCGVGNPSVNVCIPFHYKKDGCYARAHKMRYIFEKIFGYYTEKIFTYDSKTPRYSDQTYTLAVKDTNTCIYWWYHVAPIVKVAEGGQITEFVIDPSISDRPMLKEEWLSAQEVRFCSIYSRVGSFEIRPSYVYSPNGSLDEDYSNTDYILRKYSRH